MWKALIAGLFALVFAGSVQANAQSANPELESGISHFKSALRLTPEQHKHWPRVESALRSMARENARAETDEERPGLVRRVRNRVGEIAANASSMGRLVAAARPLVKSLDENQKREALSLARSMGFASLASRFE